MSKVNSTESERSYGSRFFVSFEIVLIYIASGLIVLTFFDSIKQVLYSSLGYLALAMFLTVFLAMVGYTIYNFAKGIKNLVSS